jgi:small conductance mechanosensitive channel
LNVGVAYDTNISEALELIRDILARNPRVLKDATPGVGVTTLGDSSISIAVKPWVSVADYGSAQAEIYQAVLENSAIGTSKCPSLNARCAFSTAPNSKLAGTWPLSIHSVTIRVVGV